MFPTVHEAEIIDSIVYISPSIRYQSEVSYHFEYGKLMDAECKIVTQNTKNKKAIVFYKHN
jgi:hypothetical protein